MYAYTYMKMAVGLRGDGVGIWLNICLVFLLAFSCNMYKVETCEWINAIYYV
jgi:hypothetical protein